MLSWLFGAGWRLRREPVVENLIDGVGLRPDASQRGRIDLAVFFQVENGFFRSLTKRHSKGRARLGLKTGAGLQQTLYFASRIADRLEPASPRLRRGGKFELQKMKDNPPHLAAKSGLLGNSQAFDLLGEVFPVERLIRATARERPQAFRLFFRPSEEIGVVKSSGLRHQPFSAVIFV